MGNATRQFLIVLLMACTIGTIYSWGLANHPGTFQWTLRIVLPLAGCISVALLFWAQSRQDRAPNYLAKQVSHYFERDGFCFIFLPVAHEGMCYFRIFFQSRYELPCKVRVALNRGATRLLSAEFDCEGGAFGVVWVPYGIPADQQGQMRGFEPTADVTYPNGRGRLLRFTGHSLPVQACSSQPGISWPDLRVRLPRNVAEQVDHDMAISLQTLWRPGDSADTALNTGVGFIRLRKTWWKILFLGGPTLYPAVQGAASEPGSASASTA